MTPLVPMAVASVAVAGAVAVDTVRARRAACARFGPARTTRRRVDRTVWARRLGGRRSAARSRAAVDADLPRLAEGVARELRAGATVAEALARSAALLGGEIAEAVEHLERRAGASRSWPSGLDDWADDVGSEALDQLVATIALTLDLGGAAAGAFDAVAAGLRDRAELGDEIRSLTAQGRASAILLTGLPPVAAVVLAAIDPATAQFLLQSPSGWACLVASIALMATGWWWMRWLSADVR